MDSPMLVTAAAAVLGLGAVTASPLPRPAGGRGWWVRAVRLGGTLLVCALVAGSAHLAMAVAAVPPPAARSIPAAAPPTAESDASYVVARGDSLWAIARRILRQRGMAAATADIDRMWRSIFAANHDAIGADPDLIYPGTDLIIPET